MTNRTLSAAAGTSVQFYERATFTNPRNTTGRVVAVNKSSVTTTLSAPLTFYESGVNVVIPASYVNSTNLPATLTVYATQHGVEQVVSTITLSLATTPSAPVSEATVNTLIDAKVASGVRLVAAPVGTGGADTGKIADAIAAAKSAGGRQFIQLQPGVYSVDPNSLTLDFNNVVFSGYGAGVTEVQKTGNGDLLLIKAASDAGVVQRAQVRDLRMVGNDHTGALIKSVYGSQCHIKGFEGYGNLDRTIDLVRPWDTVLDDVFLDHCGSTDGTLRPLTIRNSSAASGFGFSAGQANMVYSRGLRIESCRSAIQVVRGTGSSNDPYGIYFNGIKVETYFLHTQAVIDIVNVRGVSIRDLDLSLLGKDASTTSVVGINWAPLYRSKLDGVRINMVDTMVYRGIDSFIPGSGSHEIANVSGEGGTPGDCLINHNNTNSADIRGVTNQFGTLHGGTPPGGTDGSVRTNTQTANYTLTSTDKASVVEMNKATAATVTVPPNSSVPFPIGTIIEVQQYGAGQVTLTPGAGVTIRTSSSLTTRAQYSTVGLRKRATDEWVASGDLT